MNFNLIIARYRDPKSLTNLSVPELEELFEVLDTMENPFIRTQNAFSGNPIPDNIKPLKLILKNVIKEINSRDSLQETELTRTDLPQLQKIRLAEGVKTDIMRIIDALCALGFFLGDDGRPMARKKAMAVFGELFNGGLSGFEGLLSQSYNQTTAEKNTAIFDKMKEKIKEKMNDAISRK